MYDDAARRSVVRRRLTRIWSANALLGTLSDELSTTPTDG
jgi:hypothetical protein